MASSSTLLFVCFASPPSSVHPVNTATNEVWFSMAISSCYVVVYYKGDGIPLKVSLDTMIRDFKISVCDYWRNLTPRSIRFISRCDKALTDCDYSLQGLIVVTCSRELSSFDLFVEEACHGAASRSLSGISTQSLSDDESCTGFTETSKIKYLTEGHEQLKPLLSEGWEDIFKGVGQVFHGGVDEVRLAVSKYCSKSGYTVAKVKNDRLRNAECPWYLHCIPIDTAKSVFAIKEFNGKHKCGGAYKLKDPPVKKK
ncbi:hypothetical protein C5167_020372 [Papaver somniferum]|uniref:Transposase MuDR plant domain-containing protein n=1 Tax=Papaver somniferum TaxID=3469 RepID=A0A4Y7ISU6_PAPSO|nr:hypothetical protein C5167_020372 [Papaver somniferum]